ncbi:MAG: shikimate dehydrogenase, partial [bacterium]|nr:shikimate dehydrogenase [bacterium]
MKRKIFLLGVIGNPISHSLSPSLHNDWLRQKKLKGIYLPFEVAPARLKGFVRQMRDWKMDGLNVTLPHKETILPLLDKISPEAKIIGAVNLIVRKGKRLYGDNVDWIGYRNAYRKKFGSLKNKKVVVLGAGGAARAILYALGREKAQRIVIANRTVQKGIRLARYFQKHFPKTEILNLPFQMTRLKPFLKEADLLINTTSVGLKK